MKTFFANLVSSEPFTFLKGALVLFIGPLSHQIAYLAVIIAIDLFFGIQVARKENQFSWKTLFQKVRRKLTFYVMLLGLFHAMDMIMGLPHTARWGLIVLLAGMEILSAIKNTAKLGHQKLSEGLEQLYLSLIRPHIPTPNNSEHQQAAPEQPAEEGGTTENGTDK